MTLDQWLAITPPVRMLEVKTVEQIKELPSRIVVVEGPRSIGKTTFSTCLASFFQSPFYATWKSVRALKDCFSELGAVDGVADLKDFDLDITQGSLFALDTISQICSSGVVIDRGYFSSMYFNDEVVVSRFELYMRMLQDVQGVVIFLVPSDKTVWYEHAALRGVDRESLDKELRYYVAMSERIPSENLAYCVKV